MAKVIKLKESALVDLLEKVVKKAVSQKKKEWIAEQANAGNNIPLILERLSKLEAQKQ